MAKEAKKKIKADIREAKAEIKKLNKSKKGLKPKERKAVREQIKSLKDAIVLVGLNTIRNWATLDVNANTLDLTLEVADCQNLHYTDASFDVVSSSVGVIFAPDHDRVASELARVCRPGGRVGLTAWRKESGVGAMFATMAPFMPAPPPGAGSPLQWGDEAYVDAVLGGTFELGFEELNIPHEGENGVEMWGLFRDNFGPAFTLWTSLDVERRAELDAAMEALFESHRSGDEISYERRYIVVTGVRR